MNIQNMGKKQAESFFLRCGWNDLEQSQGQGSSEEMLGLGFCVDQPGDATDTSGTLLWANEMWNLLDEVYRIFWGFGVFFYFTWQSQLIKIFSSGKQILYSFILDH